MSEEDEDILNRELLHDHSEAGEEARYRDRLLYNSYYLSVIVLFLIAQAALTLVVNGRAGLLWVVFLSGGFVYLLLTSWAVKVRESRNSAWRRRRRIEEELTSVQINAFAALEADEVKQETQSGFSDIMTHIRENLRRPSDIPPILAYLNPDLVYWLLLPLGILMLILGVILAVPWLLSASDSVVHVQL
jgi:hypothetical protein